MTKYHNPAEVIRQTAEAQAEIPQEHHERAGEMKAEQEADFHEEVTEPIPDEEQES